MRNVSNKVVEKNSKHISYFEKLVVYEIMWKNTVEFDRLQVTISLMSIACWIHKGYKHKFRIYKASQEKRTMFWEVIVSAILTKKLYMNMCPIPNGF
jgi:hypothetical protein